MLKESVDGLQKSIQNDLKKGENLIFDGLVANVELNSLPEHIFRDYFLPGFMGTNPNPSWMLEWISIAGSPSAEVSIFNPDTGLELFKVPPVLASRNILAPRDDGSLDDVFKRSNMLSNGLGNAGVRYLHSELSARSNQMLTDNKNENNDRWYAILARYGFNTNKPESQSGGNDNDMFDY